MRHPADWREGLTETIAWFRRTLSEPRAAAPRPGAGGRRRMSRGPLVIVGDALLDRDVDGHAARLCPGEPVPVVEDAAVTERPGGAALTASAVLRALDCVDQVLIFDEDTPERVLGELRPDIWVKGGDYDGRELPEAAVLRGWGGAVITVPYLDGRSTTAIASAAAMAVPPEDVP